MDDKPFFASNAPAFVEILSWEKDRDTYIGLINQQDITPVYPIDNIEIRLSEKYKYAEVVSNNACVKVLDNSDDFSFCIDEIEAYCLLKLIK